jgi:hypothetical protein
MVYGVGCYISLISHTRLTSKPSCLNFLIEFGRPEMSEGEREREGGVRWKELDTRTKSLGHFSVRMRSALVRLPASQSFK